MIFFENLKHPLIQAVAEVCRSANESVVDTSGHGGVQASLAKLGTPNGLVMCPPERCEAVALNKALKHPEDALALGRDLHNDTMAFLQNCRAVTQAMMTAKAGQVLFVGIDDVAARIVGQPENPMANQLRVSALKSLAKEYGRMGIKYNTVLSQPSKESVEPQIWREKRDALKVYTMRFSPNETTEYAQFCWSLLQGNVPVNGGIICLGKGVMEMAA